MADPKTRSGTEAAIKAGYSVRSARSIANENLTKPDILSAIEEEKQYLLSANNIGREAAIGRLVQFAFVSIDLFVDENGKIDWQQAKEAGGLKVVKKIKETIKANGEIVREIELNDPIRAISEIADFAGWKQKASENTDTSDITARNIIRAVGCSTNLSEINELIQVAAAETGLVIVPTWKERLESFWLKQIAK